MTELIIAIVLGIIEGLTEFLPVSSTGHLIIANQVLGIAENDPFWNTFNIVIQTGAILAVVILFWKQLFPFQPSLSKEGQTVIWQRWGKTLIAFIPAAVLGFLLDDFIEEHLFNPTTVAIALVVGGLLLIFLERLRHGGKYDSVENMPIWLALGIGLFQCLAMIPGTSRSAATIIGALLLGASRPTAATFSFYLAIPTIMAASGYKMLKADFAFNGTQMAALAVGFVVSFIVAWAVIKFFMSYIARHDFKLFGWYRIALGGAILALIALGWF